MIGSTVNPMINFISKSSKNEDLIILKSWPCIYKLNSLNGKYINF